MIGRLFCFLIVGILVFTFDGLGQITSKDGLRIDFYMKGSKKPLTQGDLQNGITGSIGRYDDLLDRIVINSVKGKELYPKLIIKIYELKTEYKDNDEPRVLEPELILNKKIEIVEFSKNNPKYTVPIFPLVDYDSNFRIVVIEENTVIVEINYKIEFWSGPSGL